MFDKPQCVSDREYQPRKIALDLLNNMSILYSDRAAVAADLGNFERARALGRIQDVFSDAFINLIQK